MLQEKEKSIYIYSQRYRADRRYIERIGFIGLMKLSTGKKRNVLPHENTLHAPKLDRLNLMRRVKANLEPIFVLYEDSDSIVLDILKKMCLKAKPFINIEQDGIRHRVWRLGNAFYIKKIEKLMQPKDIFIADGHHRYETAVNYFNEIRNKNLPEGLKRDAEYVMAYFVELNDEILTILPTHRLIKYTGTMKKDDILKRISEFFHIEKIKNMRLALSKLKQHDKTCGFVMYLAGRSFYILKLKDRDTTEHFIKNSSREWKRLDVTILHLFLLQHVLKIRDDDDNVEFLKDAGEAVNLINKGKYKIAFLLNPTKILQVKRIARLGEKMPRKATYFYPKPLSGLVINKF